MKHNAHAIFDSMHDYFEGIERARSVRDKAQGALARAEESRSGEAGRTNGARNPYAERPRAEMPRAHRRSASASSESGRQLVGTMESSVAAAWEPSETGLAANPPQAQQGMTNGDWLSSIDIIQQVALRVADLQRNTRQTTEEARQIVEDATTKVETALSRERQALSLAADFRRRLGESEELVQQLRAELAEARSRTEAAEQMLQKSHDYLVRLYESLPASTPNAQAARLPRE